MRDRFGRALKAIGDNGRDFVGLADVRIDRQGSGQRRLGDAEVADGTYKAEDVIDDDGINDRPIRVAVEITIDGDRVVVDLTGSDPQAEGNTNSTIANTHAAVYYVMIAVIDPHAPPNSGCYRPIEVVTEPDLLTPQETAEACNLIRKLCRSTQKVRRGYGATRQDVNVSVAGGTRVEIKGVPQIWRIPRLIYNEASRQVALLKIRAKLADRGVTPQTLETSARDVTALLAKTSYAPIRAAIEVNRSSRRSEPAANSASWKGQNSPWIRAASAARAASHAPG